MGNQRARRQQFFAQHPRCCFCGGEALATEIDHIPARHLFRNRQWPEGYEFPACSACNRASSLDELVMGALVRIRINDANNDVDKREVSESFGALNRRRPEWMQAIREFSRNETRRTLRENGLPMVTADGSEVYVMEMPPDIVDAAQRYAEKLGRALYYKVTGRPVPPLGGVSATSLTNTQWTSPTFPLEDLQILTSQPALSRSGIDLSDQFNYRYAIANTGDAAGFLVQFGESIVMLILAFDDAATYQQIKKERAAARSLTQIADEDEER